MLGPPSDILDNINLRPDNFTADINNANNSKLTDTGASDDDNGDDSDVIFQSSVPEHSGMLVQDEEMETGIVKGHVYWTYWLAVGKFLASMVLLSILLMQGLVYFSVFSFIRVSNICFLNVRQVAPT